MSADSEVSGEAPFSYHLPIERIAQRPIYPPEAAKLLAIDGAAPFNESTFAELGSFLRAGDLLVFNQTKVSPSRLRGRLSAKGAEVELLLVRPNPEGSWCCLGKPLKKLIPGAIIEFDSRLSARVDARTGDKEIVVSFENSNSDLQTPQILDELGEMPIPPYIRRGRADAQDRVDYQSILAEQVGSIAAPTASLHFSAELLQALDQQGIKRAGVVLHLGTASFLPINLPETPDDLTPPGIERYYHSNQLLGQIATVRKEGGRVIAVGTSVVRALESMARIAADEGQELESSLFIRPGFEFLALDGIITNLHQPGTTHLLLVEAFLGRQRLEKAYEYALSHNFRFLSYGDGMILL